MTLPYISEHNVNDKLFSFIFVAKRWGKQDWYQLVLAMINSTGVHSSLSMEE